MMFWKRKETILTPARDHALALDDTFIAILLQMDQQDLLVSAQRVCKRWHDVIHQTAAIRRHLFFDITEIPATPSKHRILNPLLVKAFPSLFEDTTSERCTAETAVRRGQERTLFTGTRLYEKMAKPSIWRRTKRRMKWMELGDELAAQEKTNPFLRKDASWLRMHVSDPPVRRVCVQYVLKYIYYSDAVRDKRHFAVQIGGQGLRMGDLYSSMLSVAPWAYADGLLWPLRVPDAQEMRQCEMEISDPWNRKEPNEEPRYEGHAEPDLVVATTEAYGYSFHPRDSILASVGEIFCHEHLAKKQYGNFIGPETLKRFPKRAAVDLGLPLWVRRRLGWQEGAIM